MKSITVVTCYICVFCNNIAITYARKYFLGAGVVDQSGQRTEFMLTVASDAGELSVQLAGQRENLAHAAKASRRRPSSPCVIELS